MYIKYNLSLKSKAREMRNNPTRGEMEMWNFLRVNFPKYKFLRQKPLDEFIVDFYCIERNLIIEIDGEVHLKQKERDQERDNLFLNRYNIKTIRITNDEIILNRELVRKKLNEVLH
jgi:leucyl-tRNA synthetase